MHTLSSQDLANLIGLAQSEDGFRFQVAPEPFITPAKGGLFAEYEEYGVEDPRVCAMDGVYLITYSAYLRHNVQHRSRSHS